MPDHLVQRIKKIRFSSALADLVWADPRRGVEWRMTRALAKFKPQKVELDGFHSGLWQPPPLSVCDLMCRLLHHMQGLTQVEIKLYARPWTWGTLGRVDFEARVIRPLRRIFRERSDTVTFNMSTNPWESPAHQRSAALILSAMRGEEIDLDALIRDDFQQISAWQVRVPCVPRADMPALAVPRTNT
jgi:hypothetical protein